MTSPVSRSRAWRPGCGCVAPSRPRHTIADRNVDEVPVRVDGHAPMHATQLAATTRRCVCQRVSPGRGIDRVDGAGFLPGYQHSAVCTANGQDGGRTEVEVDTERLVGAIGRYERQIARDVPDVARGKLARPFAGAIGQRYRDDRVAGFCCGQAVVLTGAVKQRSTRAIDRRRRPDGRPRGTALLQHQQPCAGDTGRFVDRVAAPLARSGGRIQRQNRTSERAATVRGSRRYGCLIRRHRNVDGIAGDCGRAGDARMRMHVCRDPPQDFTIACGHRIDTAFAGAEVQQHFALAIDDRRVMNDRGPDVAIELTHVLARNPLHDRAPSTRPPACR